MENAYFSKDAAENLEIVTSTLRKYCILLQKEGYNFDLNEKGHRIYYDKDLLVLRRLIKYVQTDGMTLENAANAVMKHVDTIHSAHEVSEEERQRSDQKLDSLLERMAKQEEILEKQSEQLEQQSRFNRELISKLDDQQRYLNERLQDRDEQLVKAFRDMSETRKMIAANKEEKEEEEKPKGFFERLFGK